MHDDIIAAAIAATGYAEAIMRRTAGEWSPDDAARLSDPSQDIRIPPDEPHTDWRPRYGNDPKVQKWHPPFGETHVKYHIYSMGGGRNPVIWGANHHGTYQGLHTLSSPHGGDIVSPYYSGEADPDQLGRFRTPEQAKAAAEAHYHENYSQRQKMDGLDVDQVMREHNQPPSGPRRGLGEDEDYGHIFGMLRQAGWDTADIIRLAGDGMSWEDTMAYIDRTLAEGEHDHGEPEHDHSMAYHNPDCAGWPTCSGCGYLNADGEWRDGPTPPEDAPFQDNRASGLSDDYTH